MSIRKSHGPTLRTQRLDGGQVRRGLETPCPVRHCRFVNPQFRSGRVKSSFHALSHSKGALIAKDPTIRIEGLKELQRDLRKAQDKDSKKLLRKANKTAAEVVALRAAQKEAPRKSGRLRKSIGARAGQTSSKVKAGTASRVPYAGAIHFGWPRRNIRPNRFLNRALWRTRDQVRDAYSEALEVLAKALSSK